MDNGERGTEMLACAIDNKFEFGIGKGSLFHQPVTLVSRLWMTYDLIFFIENTYHVTPRNRSHRHLV